jgi:type I restriction enzyme M protein
MKLPSEIADRLKNTREQRDVVGPLAAYLCDLGWGLDQLIFGKQEWFVPKNPSEATRREKKQKFAGFPVDIAAFDKPANVGDPRHLIFIIECKQPDESAGISQLECYFMGEPHVKLGVWANDPTKSAPSIFVYRHEGRMLLKRRKIADLPRPGDAIRPESPRQTYNDLITPSDQILKKTIVQPVAPQVGE